MKKLFSSFYAKMNFNSHIDQLFLYLIYFSTLGVHVKSDKYEALYFTRENHGLVDMKKIKENGKPTIGLELAIACPAHSPHETNFNASNSHGKNSLFVKGIYEKMTPLSSVPEDICADSYKQSIIYDIINEEYALGYEIYYNLEEYKNLKHFNHAHFDSVANAYSKKHRFMHTLKLSKYNLGLFPRPKLKLEQDNGPPIPLGFLWILMIRLKFDHKMKSPTQVIYLLAKNIIEIGAECKDYNLGNEVYKKEKNDYLDSLYQNQANVFNNVEIPDHDSGCETKNECLTKYSLVPAEIFRFRSPEPKSVSCSNLTTVPIWTSKTQEVLQKLDRFLYALVNFAYRTIKVISGVRGQLVMKRNGHQGALKIRLGDENEMPVPNIIYKVVIYEFSAPEIIDGTDRYKTSHVLKAVIIVVHNDPQFDPKDAICPPDNCEKWGWSEISSSKNTYCCTRDNELVKKLGMSSYDKKYYEELNLTHFPVYDYVSSKIVTKNIQQNVKDEINKLFGEKSIPEGVAKDGEM